MNKKVLFASAVAVVAVFEANAQTKIGNNQATINPSAVLEVESTNKGVLLVRLPLTSVTSPAPLLSHVAGMIVYNTATSTTINATAVTPGYYYNDGTRWQRVGIANAVANNAAGNRVELATKSDGSPRSAGAEIVFLDNGTVGIGTPLPTAALDVNGTARIRTLNTGSTTDQIVTTDVNGNLRKLDIDVLLNGSETKISNTGSNITINGTGTTADPYTLNSIAETATATPSTAIMASSTSVAVPSTNVQGAINDLATAIVSNKATGAETKVTAGTNVTVTGTGTTATPYVVSSPVENAGATPSTAITASSTSVAVASTNVQGAISDLAKAIKTVDNNNDGSRTKISNSGSTVIVTGTGTTADPYKLNTTAITTPSTTITGSSTQVAVNATDVQGAISELSAAIITNKVKLAAGTNTTVSGDGSTGNPYKVNTALQNATQTSSTSLTANTTQVAVPSTNVQGAISDLAQAIKTVDDKVVSTTTKLVAGTNTTVSGDGSTANPYKVNTALQNASQTSSTAITGSATQVAVNATNVQGAISSLATSISGLDGTDDAWVNNTTTNTVELGTKSDGSTARPNSAKYVIKDNGSTVIGSAKLDYPSRLTLVSDNISVAGSSYLNDNFEVLSFGNNPNNSPYPVVDISSSFGTESAPANFPNGSTGVGAVRWNARAGGNKVEVARISVSYVGNGSNNLGEMYFSTPGNSNQLVLSNNGGVGVGIKTTTSNFAVQGLMHYSNNTDAKSKGLKVGDFYHTSGDVRVVY